MEVNDIEKYRDFISQHRSFVSQMADAKEIPGMISLRGFLLESLGRLEARNPGHLETLLKQQER